MPQPNETRQRNEPATHHCDPHVPNTMPYVLHAGSGTRTFRIECLESRLCLSASTPTVLASFDGTDGAFPSAGLTLSGSTLYGTTSAGNGFDNEGTVFSVPVGGGTPTVLAFFEGTDGEDPVAPLIISGNTLYGTTMEGGADNVGTVFSVPIGGGTPTVLASFDYTDGHGPAAGLTLSGDMLYGTTVGGGAGSQGTVFSVPIGGGTPTVLASFDGSDLDGGSPSGGLALSGSALYGLTLGGGVNGDGTVFSAPIDGGTPTVLASFDQNVTSLDVSSGLTLSGNTLYGTSYAGGANNDGTVFSLPITGTSSDSLAFAAQPSSTTAGASLGTITVDLDGNGGSVDASNDSTVTLAIASGPNDGTLSGTTSVAAVDGVATFSDVSIGTAGTYTLAASDSSGDTAATSASFTIGDGDLTGQFTGDIPADVSPGQTISPGLVVTDSGTGDYDQSETTDYYLSTTPDLTGVVGSALTTNRYSLDLSPGGTSSEPDAVTIPSTTADGAYYLVATDADTSGATVPVTGAVLHSATSGTLVPADATGVDGSVLATGQVTVVSKRPDLTSVTVTLPKIFHNLIDTHYAPGTVTLSVTVSAMNSGESEFKGPLTIRYYLGADSTFSTAYTAVSQVSHTVAIQPGRKITVRANVKFSQVAMDGSSIPSGWYYLFADLNPDNTVPESNVNNNAGSYSTPIVYGASHSNTKTTVSGSAVAQMYADVFAHGSQASAGLTQLTDFIAGDAAITDIRWAAYMLATAQIETANRADKYIPTFMPVIEDGGSSYFIRKYYTNKSKRVELGNQTPADAVAYCGRGYVQLTGRTNYTKFGTALGIDLINDPSLALDPATAYTIMSLGMRDGLFTGVGLSDFLNGSTDYVGARKIINGTNRNREIAANAEELECMLAASENED